MISGERMDASIKTEPTIILGQPVNCARRCLFHFCLHHTWMDTGKPHVWTVELEVLNHPRCGKLGGAVGRVACAREKMCCPAGHIDKHCFFARRCKGNKFADKEEVSFNIDLFLVQSVNLKKCFF